jgi:hypothetical protein
MGDLRWRVKYTLLVAAFSSKIWFSFETNFSSLPLGITISSSVVE